jgi:hypothetical protein
MEAAGADGILARGVVWSDAQGAAAAVDVAVDRVGAWTCRDIGGKSRLGKLLLRIRWYALLATLVLREDPARAPAAMTQSSGVPDLKQRWQGRLSLHLIFFSLHGWQAVSALVRVAMRLALLSWAASLSARDIEGWSETSTSNDRSRFAFGDHSKGVMTCGWAVVLFSASSLIPACQGRVFTWMSTCSLRLRK